MKWNRVPLFAALLAIGTVMLLVPIPILGHNFLTLLLENPIYIVLLSGWYIGRTSIAALAHVFHRRTADSLDPDQGFPSVSVIIPAYNEANIIEDVVDSILAQEYPAPVEIVIVNDGSTDQTWEILQRLADQHLEVRVFTQENQGAGTAQNFALKEATNEVIVKVDADTELSKNALYEIARPFTDSDIVGVGGNVEVLNDKESFWTRIQSFEYAVSMEMGRMFQSRLRHLLCISGAFGAFRREPLEEVGGWVANPTYGEDFDVSVRLHEYGNLWFTPDAIALTDVPPTARGWWRQRLRWARNGLRTVILHRRVLFNLDFNLAGIIGLPLKLLLIAVLLIKLTGYAVVVSQSTITEINISIALAFVSASLITAAFALFLLGMTSLFLVYRRPLRNLTYLPAYIFIYRPAHVAVKIVGFVWAILAIMRLGVTHAIKRTETTISRWLAVVR